MSDHGLVISPGGRSGPALAAGLALSMPIEALKNGLEVVEPALLAWLAGSLLAYALAANVLWLLHSRRCRSRPFRSHPAWPWIAQAARFLFYLGIPYLVLGGWPRGPFGGLLSLEDLGLVGAGPRWPAIRWLGAAGTGLAWGLAAFFLLWLAWLSANRGPGLRLRFPPRPWWELLVDGLYLQVHWAFYRAALAGALADDPYAGAFLGLAAVCLEWTLDPAWRRGWRDPARAAGQWLRLALALVTVLIFLSTRNLWVCLVVHWGLDLFFWRLGRDVNLEMNEVGPVSPGQPVRAGEADPSDALQML